MASIERKKNGSVRITVFSGYDISGKQIRHNMTIEAGELAGLTGRQREKEIYRRKLLFEEKVKNGQYLDGERITFAEFVDIWLRDYAENELAPSTLNPYKFRLENRIVPALGHIKLSKVQPQHLLKFYNNLSEAGMRLDTSYMPTELLLKRLLISSILACAVEWNIIHSNPAERVTPPKASKAKSIVKENYYSDEQVLSLFIALEDEQWITSTHG